MSNPSHEKKGFQIVVAGGRRGELRQGRGRPSAAERGRWSMACCAVLGLAIWGWPAINVASMPEDVLAERRARIEKLSPAQKLELLDHQEKFLKLPPEEQERLRRLSRDLEKDPQSQELRLVMQRYYDWLKTLPAYQRAQLRELPPEQRVERVRAILEEQSRRPGRGEAWGELARRESGLGGIPNAGKKPPRRLDPADMEGLFAWMDEYTRRNTDVVLARLPQKDQERVRQELKRVTDPVRRQELIGWIWLWWQLDNRGKPPSFSERDLAELRSKLSPATREKLEARTPAEQWRMVSGLFTAFMLRQHSARQAGVPIQSVTEKEMADFFERELTPQQRELLTTLSPDEMQRALWKMYLGWKLRQLPPIRPARDKRPGGKAPPARADDSPRPPPPAKASVPRELKSK
jgi:hypothetical protein